MMTPNGGVFGRNPKFNNVTVGGTLSSSGNVTLGSGANLVLASGNGISFAATSHPAGMTSELLSDYEEGTWTVTFFDASSGGNASPTTGTGYYTKVGRQVICTFGVGSIDTTGMSAFNPVYFTLPFTASSSLPNTAGAVFSSSVNFVNGQTYITVFGTASQSRFYFRTGGDNVAVDLIAVTQLTSGTSSLGAQFTYFV